MIKTLVRFAVSGLMRPKADHSVECALNMPLNLFLELSAGFVGSGAGGQVM
jgi:hypothetical protein